MRVKKVRRGKREDNKDRPLLFTVKDIKENSAVMGKLNKLKNALDHLKKIVVTHDLTPKQREDRKTKQEDISQKEVQNGRLVCAECAGPSVGPENRQSQDEEQSSANPVAEINHQPHNKHTHKHTTTKPPCTTNADTRKIFNQMHLTECRQSTKQTPGIRSTDENGKT